MVVTDSPLIYISGTDISHDTLTLIKTSCLQFVWGHQSTCMLCSGVTHKNFFGSFLHLLFTRFLPLW